MITEVEQSTLDIDWFFTDGNEIGFVASGGGKLPISVALSIDNVSILASYFRQLSPISDVQVNPNINSKVDERYLSDFVYMTERGLYSFDKTVLGDFSDESYHLVSTPSTPLRLKELPGNIAQLISRSMSPVIISNFKIESIR